jgi:hypothetical protein
LPRDSFRSFGPIPIRSNPDPVVLFTLSIDDGGDRVNASEALV